MRSTLVSIIIPTHNRAELLMQQLTKLSDQTFSSELFEVIVVADNCTDGTAEAVRKYSAESPFRLTVLEKYFCSAAMSRNHGADKARGEYLVFLDDDILPCREFLEKHYEMLDQGTAVVGYSKPVIPECPSLWQLNARRWWEDRFCQMNAKDYRFTYKDIFSGNLSLSAELFFRAGKFNTVLKRLEDYELGIRLLKMNTRIRFARSAEGLHCENTDVESWINRQMQEAEANIHIGIIHPEMRRELFPQRHNIPYTYRLIFSLIRNLAFRQKIISRMLSGILKMTLGPAEILNLRGVWLKTIGMLSYMEEWRGISTRMKNAEEFDAWLCETKKTDKEEMIYVW